MDIMSYLLGQNSGGAKKGMKVVVVDELPETGEVNVLYLVPKEDTGENDIFEEWLYVEDEWEKIGSTDIDLSNYYTKGEVTDITGLLANLATTSKTNLVSAINELVNGTLKRFTITTSNFQTDATLKDAPAGVYELYSQPADKVLGILIVPYQGVYPAKQILIGLQNISGDGSIGIFCRYKKQNGSYETFNSVFVETNAQTQLAIQSASYVPNLVRTVDIYRWYGQQTKSKLNTTNKDSLVDAINEINTKVTSLVDGDNVSY